MKKRILRKREKIMKNKIFLVLFLFLIFFNYLIYTNEISDSGDDFELLDIILRLESREISHPQDLVALIDFESFGTIPANVSYKIIISNKDSELYSENGTLLVETRSVLRKTFDNLELGKGFYNLQLRVNYGDNLSEEFNTSFEVMKDFEPFSKRFKDFIFNKSFIIIFSLLIIFFLILYIIRKKGFILRDQK